MAAIPSKTEAACVADLQVNVSGRYQTKEIRAAWPQPRPESPYLEASRGSLAGPLAEVSVPAHRSGHLPWFSPLLYYRLEHLLGRWRHATGPIRER